MKLTKKTILSLAAATLIGLSALTYTAIVKAAVTMHDDFFLIGNNTSPKGEPAPSVDAAPENIVEFFIRIRNNGDEEAKRVQVWSALPSESSTKLVTTAYIRPNNPDRVNVQISDTTTVNVTGGQPVGLRFLAGHTRFAGVTNRFNCPNACDINNEDILKGIEVGDLAASQEVQVAFKAFLTQAVRPTQTPTPTVAPTATPAPTTAPTAAPTAAPSASPAPSQSQQLACPAGFVSVVSGANIICIQQQQSQSQTATGGSSTVNISNVGNPTVTHAVVSPLPGQPQVVTQVKSVGVDQLPKTGLPLAAAGLGGLLPLGLKLRGFGKGKIEDISPVDLWMERQLKKD